MQAGLTQPEDMLSSDRAHMSRFIRKPAFCICKNKGTDQLHGYLCLCFCYIGSVRGSPNGTIGNFTNGTIGSQWNHWLTNGTVVPLV